VTYDVSAIATLAY